MGIECFDPMEIAEATVFVLKELRVIQWGGMTLLFTFALRFGVSPAIDAWKK